MLDLARALQSYMRHHITVSFFILYLKKKKMFPIIKARIYVTSVFGYCVD